MCYDISIETRNFTSFISLLKMEELIDNEKVTRLFRQLKNDKVAKVDVLRLALKSCNYYELEQLYQKVPAIYKGLFSLSFLRQRNYSTLFGLNIQPHCGLIDYVGKMLYVFKHNESYLNRFIMDRERVDRCVLLGSYDDAKKLLKEIDSTYGASCWSVTYQIKIERLVGGVKKAIDLHNKFYYSNNYFLFRRYCNAAFFLGAMDFSSDVKKKVCFPDDDETFDYFNRIIRSHCFAFDGLCEEDMVCSDMNSSLIDLYNYFLTFLTALSSQSVEDGCFREYLRIIADTLHDPYLEKVCKCWNISLTKAFQLDSSRQHILNEYVCGRYSNVPEMALEYLERNPIDFGIVVAYLKSVVAIGEEYPKFDKEGCLKDRICYHLLCVFSRDKDKQFHIRKLKGICSAYYNVREIQYIYVLVDNLERNNLLCLYKDFWKYSAYPNVEDSLLFERTIDKFTYLRSIEIDQQFIDTICSESELSGDCYELTLGLNDNESQYQLMCSLYYSGCAALYLVDTLATCIWERLIQNNTLGEAILFYVNQSLKDVALNIQISKDQKDCVINQYEVLVAFNPVNTAIFLSMINADVNIQYLAYKKCLRNLDVLRASEVTVGTDDKIDYFLSNVATPKVLTLHVLRFKSVKQVLEERLNICTNLNNYYDKKVYADEISSIIRDLKMLELNKQIDENKIYVDVQSIVETELDEVKDLYKMYEQAEHDSDIHQESLSQLVESLKMLGIDVLVDRKYKERLDYQLELLRKMFIYTRNQFLFNPKSGLDNYLSTRIRHGTLINQLRNHYELCNLIVNKNNGVYGSNDYWLQHIFGLGNDQYKLCDEYMRSFAEETDKLIFEIKDAFVQVYTEEHNEKANACFNYDIMYFDSLIEKLHWRTELNSFDAILSEMINLLWKRTDDCLEQMKTILQESRQKMLDELQVLERQIANVIGLSHLGWAQFHDTITKCYGDVQDDFLVVSRWFNRGSSVNFDFTIKQVIEACVGSINTNNKITLETKVDCRSETELRGKYFSTLYDMFHDIMNNVLYYEREHNISAICTIDVLEIEQMLNIRISNPIDKSDESSMLDKVNEINENLDTLLRGGKSRTEGNSGCIKIFNAVHNHLGSMNNSYVNSIENGYFVVKINLDLNSLQA